MSPWCPWVSKYVLKFGLEWTQEMQTRRCIYFLISEQLQHESGPWLSCCSFWDNVRKRVKKRSQNYQGRVQVTGGRYSCKINWNEVEIILVVCLEWREAGIYPSLDLLSSDINKQTMTQRCKRLFFYDVIPKPLPALTDVPVCVRQGVAALVDTLLL